VAVTGIYGLGATEPIYIEDYETFRLPAECRVHRVVAPDSIDAIYIGKTIAPGSFSILSCFSISVYEKYYYPQVLVDELI